MGCQDRFSVPGSDERSSDYSANELISHRSTELSCPVPAYGKVRLLMMVQTERAFPASPLLDQTPAVTCSGAPPAANPILLLAHLWLWRTTSNMKPVPKDHRTVPCPQPLFHTPLPHSIILYACSFYRFLSRASHIPLHHPDACAISNTPLLTSNSFDEPLQVDPIPHQENRLSPRSSYLLNISPDPGLSSLDSSQASLLLPTITTIFLFSQNC